MKLNTETASDELGKHCKRKSSRAAANDNPKNDEDCRTLMPSLHHPLPRDIWFEILLWFSSTCLNNIMSRVSNTWDSIIFDPCFVDTHLRRSRSGLFIQGTIDRFLEINNVNVEITDFKLESPGQLYSSYQGICLLHNYATKANYIMNPVTMQIEEIFRPVAVIEYSSRHTLMRHFSVIRDRRSRELQLVFAFQQCNRYCSWDVQKVGFKNSWKRICVTPVSATVEFPGLSIGGFVAYKASNNIVVFDVSDETIHKICCPDIKHSQVTYLQMGNDLSCISRKSEKIFVHILMDFHAGIWSLYHILDYGYIPGKPLEFQHFLGWINNCEELLVRLCTFVSCQGLGSCYENSCYKTDFAQRRFVRDKRIYCTYNLKTKRITDLNRYISEQYRVQVHINSLISWKPLQA